MESSTPIPDQYQALINAVGNHNQGDREYREGMAEIQVRSIMVQEQLGEVSKTTGEAIERATAGLRNATWVLAGVTVVLVVIAAFKN